MPAASTASAATLYKFKAKFGGMDVSEARRPRAPEDENARLKKLLAEQTLDNPERCRPTRSGKRWFVPAICGARSLAVEGSTTCVLQIIYKT